MTRPSSASLPLRPSPPGATTRLARSARRLALGGWCALGALGAATIPGCGGPEVGAADPGPSGVAAAATIPGCPGVWGDADSYAGLTGLFVQPLPYTAALTHLQVLTALPIDPVRTGGQLWRTELGVTRAGRYVALESNPAIGAVLSIWDAGREDPDVFFVLGVRRSSPLRVSALCLLGSKPDGRPFVLQRAGL